MNDLLKFVIEAHGGLDKWSLFESITAQLNIGGLTWKLKGYEGLLNNVNYLASLHRQYGSHLQIFSPELKSVFEPGRVALETHDGRIVEELLNPRASFVGQQLTSPWNKLQVIYFACYATWTYLTTPFNFAMPGFEVKEIEPWHESGEVWRRLEVLFPEHIESHSKRQIFYYDQNGFLKRHDYWPDVLGGAPSAHYVFDYKQFSGIWMPTRRRVYRQDDHNGYKPEPLLVTIDIVDVKFEQLQAVK